MHRLAKDIICKCIVDLVNMGGTDLNHVMSINGWIKRSIATIYAHVDKRLNKRS